MVCTQWGFRPDFARMPTCFQLFVIRRAQLQDEGTPLTEMRAASGASSKAEYLNRTWRSRVPEFVIERNMPGVGSFAASELKGASQTSCSVLRKLGPNIQWVHSYITDDKIYCIYRAPSEDMIREHAQTAGFPANSISRVRTIIDPTTAE
jgi:hypothetical protein